LKTARRFSPKEAEEIYLVPYWGAGFFRVGRDGELEVTPLGPEGPAASLLEIVEALRDEGRPLPLVLRFPQILEARVRELNEAFRRAMEKYGYTGGYRGVYPVKVNQRRLVLETVAKAGRPYHYGLEAGSKAELALILAQDLSREGPRVVRLSKELGVKPQIGIRYKLKAKGAGQWEASGGENAKFGLTTPEIIRAVEILKEEGLLDALVMVHAHIGSQVTDIRRIKMAVREAAQTYVQLRKLGAPLAYLNLGGGLAVDYDGSKTNFYASANYTLPEYAEDLVYVTKEVVEAQGEPHPTLVTESGRAVTAYHQVLVLEVIDVITPPGEKRPEPPPEEAHPLVKELWESLQSLSAKNFREVYHDAFADKETLQTLYDLGLVSLRDRALAEEIFYHVARRVYSIVRELPYAPDEFEDLEKLLADKLVCNFSIFQSLPDAWAIHQLFPIVPLSRLHELPTRQATLVDISCDSDGKIDRFIDLHDVRQSLPVHPIRPGEPYYLGVFLVGAYQDVLGSNHNLFGQVGEAHVVVDEEGFAIERFIPGETAEKVIEKMGFSSRELFQGVERLVRQSRLSPAEKGAFLERYMRELQGYTYLED